MYIGNCYFKFGGEKYPFRVVRLGEKWGEVVVSIQSLNDMLFDMNGKYKNSLAEIIDEQVFFFVADEIIDTPESFLATQILEEVA